MHKPKKSNLVFCMHYANVVVREHPALAALRLKIVLFLSLLFSFLFLPSAFMSPLHSQGVDISKERISIAQSMVSIVFLPIFPPGFLKKKCLRPLLVVKVSCGENTSLSS